MASTQTLTELPSIHYTGMDYNTVISQIKEIIENNSNWASNWTQFYNSEAGTMLIQLMAWICDTMGVRQDLLYNEMFMSTATTDKAKRRLLNLVGYTRQSASAASFPISVQFDDVQSSTINLSNCRDDESDISSIVYNIFRFYGKDKNGDSKAYEILNTNSDGTINYTQSVKLNPGQSYYTADSNGNTLKAVEGSTVYREFTSDTSDGPSFVLEDENIDLKTLVVYDITNNQNLLHQRVENFLDLSVLNTGSNICYTISVTDDGYYQINYPTLDIVTYGSQILEDRLFTSGNTIGVLYRTTNGAVGNIPSNYISTDETTVDVDGNIHNITISNILSGSGGKDKESLTSALKNYTQSIKTMNRAITITDYDTLLKQNSMVLNCKSYSPENMPSKFVNYFGRRINPQEIFSFVVLNKATENVPSESLNYYPWVYLNKDPVLNEKYVFGDAVLNEPWNALDTGSLNIYIKDDISEDIEKDLNGIADSGQNFYERYNFTLGGTQYKARQLPNATLYKTGSMFGDTIKSELANQSYFLKIKFSNTTSSENYIKNMTNSFLDSTDNLTTDNNIIEEETNAVYNGSSLISTTDMINYKFLKFVLDDNLKFAIDLQAQKSSDDVGVEDDSSYYLKFYNESPDSVSAAKSNYTGDWDEYKSTKEFAKYRYGIVQQIRTQVSNQLNYIGGTDSVSADTISKKWTRYKGYYKDGNTIRTILWKHDNDEKNPNTNIEFLLTNEVDGVTADATFYKTSNLSSTNNLSHGIKNPLNDKEDSSQEMIIRNRLADGSSAYLDLGLQESSKSSGDFLYASYYRSMGQDSSNLDTDKLYRYYAIKINGTIYALRIDGQTASFAADFYNSTKTYNGYDEYYDYFPYIGYGELIDINKILSSTAANTSEWLTLLRKSEGILAFSRETINQSAVTLNSMLKTDVNGGNTTDKSYNKYVSFSVEQLAAVMEYLLSVFNTNAETVYKWNGVDVGWTDIRNIKKEDNFENILNGKLRVCCVEKDNFSNEHCLNLPIKTANSYTNGKEYDIRFEYFNMKDDNGNDETLEVSSVANSEISDSSGNIINIDGNADKPVVDLIQSIFSGYIEDVNTVYKDSTNKEEKTAATKYLGQKRKYSASRIDYLDHVNDIVSYGMADEDGESGYLYFKSLATGRNSSIYFVQTAAGSNYEFMILSGLFNGFCYSNNITRGDSEYIDRAKSEKAIGIKRVELITSTSSLMSYKGADNSALKIAGNSNTQNPEYYSLETGDIVITDNDINHSNISSLYFSYILKDTDTILLNKRDNFYYSSDEETNEYAKPPIVCIEGAAISQDSDGNYFIDRNKSNYDVRLTAEEQDVNSLYAITKDTLSELDTIKVDRVTIETSDIPKIDTNSSNTTTFYASYGLGYGYDSSYLSKLQKIADFEVPLIYSIDDTTSDFYAAGEDGSFTFDYDSYQDKVIAVNPGPISSITGSSLFSKIREFLKNSDTYYKSYGSMIKKVMNNSNKFILSGLSPNGEGNITFYYPSTAIKTLYISPSAESQGDDSDYELACKVFYLHLFGTNKTNADFYNLYPKEAMTNSKYGLNSSSVVSYVYIDSEHPENNEYFYCPTKKYPLKFVYRCYTSGDKEESRFGDYYVTAEPKTNNVNNFKSGYNFYLNKTQYANFPDTSFYIHFINDRRYEYDSAGNEVITDEDNLSEYMDQYKITGMDSYFLAPYFKTFDIVGTVNYDANYDVSTIRQTIDSKLKQKYSIANIQDFVIGQDIYRSDIFKIILSVEGVESAQIEYFGYNYDDQDTYPDQKYVLTTGSGLSTSTDNFYIIPVLHDTTSSRGIVLSYNKVATSTIYSN